MIDIHVPTEQEIEEAVRVVPFKEIGALHAGDEVASNKNIAMLASGFADHVRKMVKKHKMPQHLAVMAGLASMFEVGVLVGIQIGRTRQTKDQQGRLQ